MRTSEVHQDGSRAVQKACLVLVRLRTDRRAEDNAAQHGDRKRFALREDPIRIAEKHGDQIDVGSGPREMIEARLEFADGSVARAPTGAETASS